MLVWVGVAVVWVLAIRMGDLLVWYTWLIVVFVKS